MSIETELGRIATAVEGLLSLAQQQSGMGAIPEPDKKKPGRPAKTAEPTPTPAPEDMFGAEAPKVVTVDELRDHLRAHMAKFGQDATKALMIGAGADATKPVITSIPAANYAALMKKLAEAGV